MLVALIFIAVLSATIFIYMQKATFGKAATGERLERMKKSPNYKDGKFQNQHHTPALTEGYSYTKVLYEFLFKKKEGRVPVDSIPSVKTDLLNLAPDQDILVWFGHSSYFMQLDGKRILVDPVFSGNASPLRGSNKAFKGTDRYTVADLPEIDYLFISHDHYDHADYETLIQLKSKTKKVICGLGVGGHLEHWGFQANNIIEKDWNEQIELDKGFVVYTTPARHFSGRGFTRNNTLWLSFLFQSPTKKIYIGGDSGYDTHFAEIGSKHGPIDLAILENGQYDIKWKYIHMLPDEVLQAGKDLKAKRVFPVHSSKFAMANHAWHEPLTEVTQLNKSMNIPLVTPIIGEAVNLNDDNQQFKQWWVGIK
ncbi:MAG: beta-lactamase [Segetibacter sp.]|nr:beta-lactamase [Segetibacter sp.]